MKVIPTTVAAAPLCAISGEVSLKVARSGRAVQGFPHELIIFIPLLTAFCNPATLWFSRTLQHIAMPINLQQPSLFPIPSLPCIQRILIP